MKLAKQMVYQKDGHFRRIAQNLYKHHRAELMAALDLERVEQKVDSLLKSAQI